jgi:hypothetical protein
MPTPSYDELAPIPAKEWKKLMEEGLGERSGQVGEGSGSNASLPTAAELEAFEQGIKEGLAEGLTLETAPQDAVEPNLGLSREWLTKLFVSPRDEGESSKDLW